MRGLTVEDFDHWAMVVGFASLGLIVQIRFTNGYFFLLWVNEWRALVLRLLVEDFDKLRQIGPLKI